MAGREKFLSIDFDKKRGIWRKKWAVMVVENAVIIGLKG